MSLQPADEIEDARNRLNRKMIDLSHWNHVTKKGDSGSGEISDGFEYVKQSGVDAVFLKATQGISYVDPTFFDYVKRANAAKLFIGAYHFGTAAPVKLQLKNFADAVSKASDSIGKNIALALDFENNEVDPPNTIAISQAVEFLDTLEKFRPFIYGGGYLRGQILHMTHDPHHFAARLRPYRLWFNDMGWVKNPRLPILWPSCIFWQYSSRIPCPGVTGAVDSNHYFGNDLAAEFANGGSA